MTDPTITLYFGAVDLTVAEVWPDGNAPEQPTADDVAAVMKAHGSFASMLSDWNIVPSASVEVNGGATPWATSRSPR